MSGRDAQGRWLPGTSGNPAGRPAYRQKAEETFSRLLAEAPDADGKSVADRLLERLLDLAENGDGSLGRWALEAVVDRLLPKTDRHEVGGLDGQEVRFRWAAAAEEGADDA